jgi:hypothetical protein
LSRWMPNFWLFSLGWEQLHCCISGRVGGPCGGFRGMWLKAPRLMLNCV